MSANSPAPRSRDYLDSRAQSSIDKTNTVGERNQALRDQIHAIALDFPACANNARCNAAWCTVYIASTAN
jgi:hypothetical protein